MIIDGKKILNLPVVTKSGHHLGRVSNFEVDIDSQKIIRFHVKSGLIIGGLMGQELLIHSEQVVSIALEKMIVEDSVGGVTKKVATVST